ncbi:PREDICTED: LOB domain-containing protein 39-like [Ipomoea nil]|uniref:LOB domain-containing protein 39-like n=1 Tax=Ipomoea nil TaxID=35883 RepID=UPI000900BD35|nr:PREDICTED: LOB domain-containing protein 39-like [Ipomoea nil]
MSCNGCRVLRRGCGVNCILRSCLEEIDNAQAQANATLFVSKFFGRSDLMSFISSVPNTRRPALFKSLLYEACGRTVNPVSGAVGLLSTGNWHVCVQAVETVLAGGALQPIATEFLSPPSFDDASRIFHEGAWKIPEVSVVTQSQPSDPLNHQMPAGNKKKKRVSSAAFGSETETETSSEVYGCYESGCRSVRDAVGGKEPKLLNLFV